MSLWLGQLGNHASRIDNKLDCNCIVLYFVINHIHVHDRPDFIKGCKKYLQKSPKLKSYNSPQEHFRYGNGPTCDMSCAFLGRPQGRDKEPLTVNMENPTTVRKIWVFFYCVKRTLLVNYFQKYTLKVPASSHF